MTSTLGACETNMRNYTIHKCKRTITIDMKRWTRKTTICCGRIYSPFFNLFCWRFAEHFSDVLRFILLLLLLRRNAMIRVLTMSVARNRSTRDSGSSMLEWIVSRILEYMTSKRRISLPQLLHHSIYPKTTSSESESSLGWRVVWRHFYRALIIEKGRWAEKWVCNSRNSYFEKPGCRFGGSIWFSKKPNEVEMLRFVASVQYSVNTDNFYNSIHPKWRVR